MKKICEFLNCKEEGIYPAPRSRKDITNYKYYCIEHIRDFNKSWNFFEGLTEEQFENEIRKSTTWDRPSWKFGTSNFNKKINDTYNFFKDIENKNLSKKKINSRLRIINIASRAAFRGEQQDYISYACSKGGIISLTKTMSRSFGESDNIVAISIAPGFVRTEMAQSFIDKHGEDSVKQGITLDRLTEPKDISPIVSLIVSGKMDHSTGSTIDVNGGSFLR